MNMRTMRVVAGNGTEFLLRFPTDLPTQERGEMLRETYNARVKALDESVGWKGPCEAYAGPDLVDVALVAESMEFMGSVVDSMVKLPDGRVCLYSHGYFAHGF